MLPPQSDIEVEPVRAAIRGLDPLLDIVWNPQAKQFNHGRFDAWGVPLPPTYSGRWQVVRYATYERDRPAVIYTLGADDPGEPYRDVGPWLVSFLQKWDRAQAHAAEEMERAWREHERAEESLGVMDEGLAEEALEKLYAAHGHAKRLYEGRGFGKGTRSTTTHTDVI